MTGELLYLNDVSGASGENDGSRAPQAQLAIALNELAAASTRVYYDASEDNQARNTYFADIDAQLEPVGLFRQLSTLLRTTHGTRPAYKPSKLVYPWVDLHPDLKVHSIYSGIVYDPETLIREDFRIDAERAQRVRELFARESHRELAVLHEELDLLEAALPYNCEHSVPQSWFAKKEPMRGDLHHLFACESRCNSFRGNHAYFDFPDFERVVRDDCGKREDNRFEPSSLKGKGVVARATLYFLLRYPGLIATAGGEFDAARLPVLLDWHRQAPPDDYEKHRNMAIFAIQRNRNPLIDFPNWAEQIDFQLGFG